MLSFLIIFSDKRHFKQSLFLRENAVSCLNYSALTAIIGDEHIPNIQTQLNPWMTMTRKNFGSTQHHLDSLKNGKKLVFWGPLEDCPDSSQWNKPKAIQFPYSFTGPFCLWILSSFPWRKRGLGKNGVNGMNKTMPLQKIS